MLPFQRGRFSRHIELTRFLVVVLVGLALNTPLVWFFVYPLAIPPAAAKIAASAPASTLHGLDRCAHRP